VGLRIEAEGELGGNASKPAAPPATDAPPPAPAAPQP